MKPIGQKMHLLECNAIGRFKNEAYLKKHPDLKRGSIMILSNDEKCDMNIVRFGEMMTESMHNVAAKDSYYGSNYSYGPGKEEKKNEPKECENRVARCHDVK